MIGRAILALCLLSPAAYADGPERVVSVNLCADQLLVILGDPQQVVSVSFLARDRELSYVADRVEGVPINHGGAEEVLEMEPDLVLAGTYGARGAVRLLEAYGTPVLKLGLTENFADIRTQVTAVAEALGKPASGAAENAAMRADLAAAEATLPPPEERPRAVIFQADGFTAGAGTLTDAVLSAAGFRNVAAEIGMVGYGYMPLETLLYQAPDLVIAERDSAAGDVDAPSLATALLDHPALREFMKDMPVVEIPSGSMACGGPYTVRAVLALVEARRALEAAGAS
ncbi:ABC transporter substrate-binding protein [Inquilinus sp. CAU 1745]|uniref:ABC transporter substrate-binding protein n=1 Tax=Inquilinus sp. CAU 1745 TaxID=3140369 RepID=UPI00325B77AF